MATIAGTTGNDVITGTTGDDTISGGDGADRINGGSGNDVLSGDAGNDTLTGDAGNDTLYGGDGDDGFFGGGGNDTIYGEAGNDVMYGDGGNDALYGSDGNDTLNGGTGSDVLYGGAGFNTYIGGAGYDTFVIELSSADVTKAIKDDLSSLNAWMIDMRASAGSTDAQSAQTSGPTLTLSALGLSINTVEAVKILLDGVETPIEHFLNQSPEAEPEVTIGTTEDTPVSGTIAATDADGDALNFELSASPLHGTLTLDAATGNYTYLPASNFSGSDSFEVFVTDPSGAAAIQRVTVNVAGAGDAPTLSVTDKTVVLTGGTLVGSTSAETIVGQADTTVIYGGAGNDTITAGSGVITTDLDVTAALTDLDGSETLSVRIAGMPTGATLSAGTVESDGSWTLGGGDLAGLKITTPSASDITLQVTAVATEADGDIATTSAVLSIVFDASNAQSTIEGGSGSDVVLGGLADEVIYGSAKPSAKSPTKAISTEADNDELHGGGGNDTIYGQRGNDKIWGDAGNDTLSGGKGDDHLWGGDGDDTLNGNSGNDVLDGGAGSDQVLGCSGDDVIIAGTGNDLYNGGSGFDTLDFGAASTGVTVDISKKTATGLGDDTFSSIEKFIGSSGDDWFKGSSNADQIDGGAGNDWIRGLGGADKLTGGAGSDTYFWEKTDVGSAVDRITDFGTGDVLDFRKLVSLGSKSLADIVKVTDSGDGLTVSAKVGTSFVTVAVLEGVHDMTAADLLAQGNLLVG